MILVVRLGNIYEVRVQGVPVSEALAAHAAVHGFPPSGLMVAQRERRLIILILLRDLRFHLFDGIRIYGHRPARIHAPGEPDVSPASSPVPASPGNPDVPAGMPAPGFFQSVIYSLQFFCSRQRDIPSLRLAFRLDMFQAWQESRHDSKR